MRAYLSNCKLPTPNFWFVPYIFREVDTNNKSSETMSLCKEFSIAGYVHVLNGRGGLPKVTLSHPSGSCLDIYLLGANILSWTLPSGGEVFYTPDGIVFSEENPIDWGTIFCFPQFGEGEDRGTLADKFPLPFDGFAKSLSWTITQTGLHEDKHGTCPYVIIELHDSEATRAVWNHSFHLTMEITLEHAALNVSLSVKNTSSNDVLECSAAFKSHVAVMDVEDLSTNYIGFDDCIFLDNTLHPTKPRVRFTGDERKHGCLKLTGPTDRVYLNTKNDTGIEIGSGCTVLLRNTCHLGTSEFNDRAIFNPWNESDPKNYRWYSGLAIGAIGRLLRIDPDDTHSSSIRLEVKDNSQQIISTLEESDQKLASDPNSSWPKFNVPAETLPRDLQ